MEMDNMGIGYFCHTPACFYYLALEIARKYCFESLMFVSF